MTSAKIINKKISSGLEASVISAAPDTKLDQPLWAVNWFDLKKKWMYNLYNRLVLNHVLKIGGRPVFKGELVRTLIDNERLRRDMLLVVRYPKAESFLRMISSKVFQLKGLLRSSSVRHFQFGFMNRLDQTQKTEGTTGSYKGSLKYLVLVCEGGQFDDLQSLIRHAASFEVFPHFSGQKSAMMGLHKDGGNLKTLDFVLSHTLIFSGFESENLERFAKSDFYQEYFAGCTHNFAGVYRRLI